MDHAHPLVYANRDSLRRHAWGSVACIAVLLGTMALSGRGHLGFLPWNLGLAWIPYLLTRGAARTFRQGGRTRFWGLALFVVWLLFLPNAPYIVTDFVHVARAPEGSALLYAVAVSVFAMAALLLGLASLRIMHAILRARLGPRCAWLVLGNVCGLTGLGVYMGRVLRWNSWDVVTEPIELLRSTFYAIFQAPEHLAALGYSLGFGVAFFLAYVCYLRAPRLKALDVRRKGLFV